MDLMLNEYSVAQGQAVIQVHGEIDVYTAPRLRETLVGLVEAGSHHLIVDMEGVEFLDSTGLGVLVGGLKRVRAHDGGIDLVCTKTRILRIFRITGLNKVFSIYDSVDEAVASRARRDIRLAPEPGTPGSDDAPAHGRNALRLEGAQDKAGAGLWAERGRLAWHSLTGRRDFLDGGERNRVDDHRGA
jgi:anti-sigma B factor antagonist